MPSTYNLPELNGNAVKAVQSLQIIYDTALNEFRIVTQEDLGVNVSGLSLQTVVRGGLTNQTYPLVLANTSVMVLNSNANRNFLFIQNNLTGSVSIGLGSAATPPQGNNCLFLASGDSLAFQSTFSYTGTVSCLPLGGITGNLSIQEG